MNMEVILPNNGTEARSKRIVRILEICLAILGCGNHIRVNAGLTCR